MDIFRSDGTTYKAYITLKFSFFSVVFIGKKLSSRTNDGNCFGITRYLLYFISFCEEKNQMSMNIEC